MTPSQQAQFCKVDLSNPQIAEWWNGLTSKQRAELVHMSDSRRAKCGIAETDIGDLSTLRARKSKGKRIKGMIRSTDAR